MTIILAIACLLIAVIPVVLAATDTTTREYLDGTISVTSYPNGAAVYLDEVYRGVAPVEIYNLPQGQYSVTASLAGYNTESLSVVLWAGHIKEITFRLQQTPSVSPTLASPMVTPVGSGSIAIDSVPGEAYVYLDGVAVGRTPATHSALILNSIPSGSHIIRVEIPGYIPYANSVYVTQNQVSQVNAVISLITPPVVTTEPTPLPQLAPTQLAPTQQSGLPPAIVIGAVGLIGMAAVFRRS